MKLQDKRVVVVGMARSGRAAVELLLDHGAHVTAVDQNAANLVGVEPQTERAFDRAELVVLSPGVPADLAELESARRRGVRIVGDLELASWFLRGDIIGITGANGKTTTTALTGHILRESHIEAQVGGNIGTPPASMVKTSRGGQWNVLELSSFQLETTEQFRAHIGAALNVTPDHLDRHHTLANYAAAKGRLFVNQREGDFAVLNADDVICKSYASLSGGKAVWFSLSRNLNPGAWFDGTEIHLNGQRLMAAIEVPLRGLHNIENAMAAALIANTAGTTPSQIRAAIMSFPGVEHRLEFVRTLDGVAWYNDSKATNVDATLKAIHAFPGGLWVILGGKDKDSDYSVLAEPLQKRAHAALLIGAAAGKIEAQLTGALPLISCLTLESAVAEARTRARSGDTVLLAPACASFDQFENYEHRGREFKRMVHALRAQQEVGWQN